MRCSTHRRPVAPTESGDGFVTQRDYPAVEVGTEPVVHWPVAPVQAPDEVFQPVDAGPHHSYVVYPAAEPFGAMMLRQYALQAAALVGIPSASHW